MDSFEAMAIAMGLGVVVLAIVIVLMLIEAKLRGETPDPAIFRDAIAALIRQPGGERLDSVVLACTHFPLVQAELAAAAPHPLRFIDGAEGIARRTAHLLPDAVWPAPPPAGRAIFTGGTDSLSSLAPTLREFGLTSLEEL